MAIGEWTDPAQARVNAALEVGWQLGRAFGLEEGYRAAQVDADDRWREASRVKIFSAGELLARPIASEQRAAREQILREGHAVGFHANRAAYGCPCCARPPTEVESHSPDACRELGGVRCERCVLLFGREDWTPA